ncbi:MAG: pyridoxal phosphate-dependent aminotransferase [bacterium]|nr:pyridoxal phosphate-dependent aminotransferase [bacterium]
MSLSRRARSISPSPTLAITAKAKEMKKSGIPVISFGAGEPDFDTPAEIKMAGSKAIKCGFTKYTPDSGIIELKEAVCQKFKEDNGLDYETSEILISCGAKHSLFNAIFALCDEGDEVIIPSPYWVTYPEQVKMTGARPVIVETFEGNDFKLTPAQFKENITSHTKAIILNSPSNPTGSVYEPNELEGLARVAVEAGVYIISDEIYEKLIYDGKRHISVASLGKEIKDLTITINGVSKAYSMTGWRIGYAAGPKDVIRAMSSIQSHTTSNPTSISQLAALEAIKGRQECVAEMVKEFNRRRKYIVDRLNKIRGISCITPYGAFYVFPNVESLLSMRFKGEEIKDSFRLSQVLLNEAHIAVVPGSAFGASNYLRLSYATSLEDIENGLDRIEKILEKLE